MQLRTKQAPPKLVDEELKYSFDWNPALGEGDDADEISGTPTIAADQDVAVNGIAQTDAVTEFWVRAGGLPGFNLALMLTADTTGGQTLQQRLVIPITTR